LKHDHTNDPAALRIRATIDADAAAAPRRGHDYFILSFAGDPTLVRKGCRPEVASAHVTAGFDQEVPASAEVIHRSQSQRPD
jgi:hypothetical protein